MGIKDILGGLIPSDLSRDQFDPMADSMGVNFYLRQDKLNACEAGEAGDWLLHQYVYFKMLEEQGLAEPIRGGFAIQSEDVVRLDAEAAELLGLPRVFPGSFLLKVEGTTFSDRFNLEIIPVSEGGEIYPVYEVRGPFIQFGGQEEYSLSPAQYHAYNALKVYRDHTSTEKSERQNLLLVARLQEAKSQGMKIDLSLFDEYQVDIAEAVGVTVVEQRNGGLVLVPSYGTDLDPVEINNRLHQVLESDGEGSLRVGKHIICLDKKSLKATKEIISNRRVNKEDVKEFLASPSAFLDASLVNLDIGFSLRVHGATEFKHAYFGETDESGISWFSTAGERIHAPTHLKKLIQTEEDLEGIESRLDDAEKAGAQQIKVEDCLIDVSDAAYVKKIVENIRQSLESSDRAEQAAEKAAEGEVKEEVAKKAVLDIDLNDESASFALKQFISDVSYNGTIDFSAYHFDPYTYQQEGIRWIVGLSQHTLGLSEEQAGFHGVLLADDMGLGKTFMSLAAVREYQLLAKQQGEPERPVLVVAPLSLLENWLDEVAAVYKDRESPFDSIVTLQSDGDLNTFRALKGTETTQPVGNDGIGIRYALKVGKGVGRLDVERRLVLTTYETLRDYQFSLSVIDWSFVIFDEAQRIKNPNALWTRAAKGLKARFKLLATGTPVENHLGDFWCLMDTARPGELGAYQEFRAAYIKPITSASEDEKPTVRQQVGRQLRMAVGAYMLRRVKEDHLEGLPTKTVYAGEQEGPTKYMDILACPMSASQQQRYDTVISLVQDEQDSGGSGNVVLAGLHRLQDVSLHPGLLDGGLLPMPSDAAEARAIISESGKLQQMLALLEEIRSRQEKVIIFAINKRLQSFLKVAVKRIYGINVSVINGDTRAVAKSIKKPTRKMLIAEFERTRGFGVIIMSPVAAGMGLTIVGANNVIHIQRHWNPAKEAQATDRVYRIGQKKPVNVYLPILQHPEVSSFDVNLNRLLIQKSALKNAVMTPEEVNPQELGDSLFGDTVNPAQPDYIKLDHLRLLSWEQFEAFAVELIAATVGGDALLTKAGTDSGADGIVWSPKGNILIQAKHSESLRPVNEDAPAQVYAAKPKYESNTGKTFDRLLAITNAKNFSGRVRKSAKASGVELLDLGDIKRLLKKHPIDCKAVMKRLGKARLAI